MTTKTCIDIQQKPFAAMQEALAENPQNLPDIAQLAVGQQPQRLRQAMSAINVRALPTPPGDIFMDMPVLQDPIVQSGLQEQMLRPLSPADRLHVVENNLVPSLMIGSLALVTGKLWQNGRTLRITFMDGPSPVRSRVIELARQWEDHANLHFDFLDDGLESDIRIAFQPGGSWSYIGTDAKLVPQEQPTMNFGWLTAVSSDDTYSRVVLHEFGHALGAIHEHQHPEGKIPWDKEAVYAYYGGPPNNWSQEQVDVNLFQKYDSDQLNYSAFDPASIMLYPILNELTDGDWEVGWNAQLSAQDKEFMSNNYPFDEAKTGVTGETAVLSLNAPPLSSTIYSPGEIKRFSFTADVRGQYYFETSGNMDVFMSIFAANNGQQPLAEDDDGGEGWNAKLLVELDPGDYEVQVRHYNDTGTGSFAIWAF